MIMINPPFLRLINTTTTAAAAAAAVVVMVVSLNGMDNKFKSTAPS